MRYSREDGCLAWLTYGVQDPSLQAKLLEIFGSAEAIYDYLSVHGAAFLEPYLPGVMVAELTERAQKGAMHEMMLTMQKHGLGVITQNDLRYPDALRDITDPPTILFYQGELDCLMGKCITIVGSRRPSPNAIAATETVARDLSDAGVTVVSGGAVGIDAAAHRGCLQGASPTAAVLACGLDVAYPAEHRSLKRQILEAGGAILSEYPPGSPALTWHFPVRNRIMSGLGKAVLLMEARLRSGSMTTVQHALDQGREVYAYPGVIGSEWAEASHQLLREGAGYFTNARDILDDLGWKIESKPVRRAKAKADLPQLTDEQRSVLTQLSQGEKSFDELAQATGMNAPALSGALTMLQILGLIRPLPGKTFEKI